MIKKIIRRFKEVRVSKELVDSIYYYKCYPDIENSLYPAYFHYSLFGWKEGRNPNDWFDTNAYLEFNPDVKEANINPLVHYFLEGKNEGRRTSGAEHAKALENKPQDEKYDIFDAEFYLATYRDVDPKTQDPYFHYINHGEAEGRRPNKWFDPAFYKSLYADIRIHNLNAFQHYVNHGKSEGKAAFSTYYNNRLPDLKPVLFVGHDGIKAGSELVLLEVIKWFYHHTRRPIKVLLLATGELSKDYAQYAEVYVLNNQQVDDKAYFRKFLTGDFEFAYLNTVVTGSLFKILDKEHLELHCPIINHIHEMEKVLNEYIDEFNLLKENTDHWISASAFSTSDLVDKFLLDENNISTVSAFINPICKRAEDIKPLREKARKELGLKSDSFVVAACGTVYWRKGPDIFLETARILKELTNEAVEFVWIGAGPDIEKYQNDLVDDEQNYIHFVGNKTNANELLSAADLFFLSSREDPFPLVVLEAAQFGIPTLCFREATGITGFIKKDAGLVVDTIDCALAAKGLLDLLQDTAFRTSLGEVARNRVFNKYTSAKQCMSIYDSLKKNTNYEPCLTVIVPFYKHEKFVEERINSILNQTIKDIEVIALDDVSPDGTRSEIERLSKLDSRLTYSFNKKNSGSPFKQWRHGLELSSTEIVWIAEGDDSCSGNFLEVLLPYFQDPFINIASARTEIINEEGTLVENALKPYLNGAYPEKFDNQYVRDGLQEVNENLGAICTLVNASGLLIRKSSVLPILEEASKYRMCGDWLIYLNALKGGKIAYDPAAVNYFRRHSQSVVHEVEGTETYFKERFEISKFVVDNYSIHKQTLTRAFNVIDKEWERFLHKKKSGGLEDFYNKKKLTRTFLNKRLKLKNKHIAFYVHGMLFSKGGIEKLAADLINQLVDHGVKVTLYCRVWGTKQTVYPLKEAVNVHPIFDENDIENSKLRLKKSLLNSDIDLMIPMLSEWLFDPIVEAAYDTGVAIIASEHNDPWVIEEKWWSRKDRINCFEKVDRVHVLLNKFIESLPETLQDKVHAIPNGINIPKKYRKDKENLIIGVGRLVEQKRFDRLIEAISLINNLPADWRVEIYGEGPDRKDLQNKIDEKGLQDVIELKGNIENIDEVYEKASIFAMTSEFEGFGIALVEAMSHGVVPIGYKDCNGPNEIIRDGKDGYLVDNEKELSEKIISLITREKDISKLRKQCYERSSDYSMEKFFDKWNQIIESVILN